MDERSRLLGRRLAALHQKQTTSPAEIPAIPLATSVKEASGFYHPSGTAPLRQQLDRLIQVTTSRARDWPQFGVIHGGDFLLDDDAIAAIEHGSGMGWRSIDLAAVQNACERALGGAQAPIWQMFTSSYCEAWPLGHAVVADLDFGSAWLAVAQAKSALDAPDRHPAGYRENLMRSLGDFLRARLANY
jgi:hypothetical protein